MELGLNSSTGVTSNRLLSLLTLNDSVISWPEIANFVEENFDKVFNKSY